MQVMHRTGFIINSISDGNQRNTKHIDMATGTKKLQSESPKSNAKKTNSRRRRQPKNG